GPLNSLILGEKKVGRNDPSRLPSFVSKMPRQMYATEVPVESARRPSAAIAVAVRRENGDWLRSIGRMPRVSATREVSLPLFDRRLEHPNAGQTVSALLFWRRGFGSLCDATNRLRPPSSP